MNSQINQTLDQQLKSRHNNSQALSHKVGLVA